MFGFLFLIVLKIDFSFGKIKLIITQSELILLNPPKNSSTSLLWAPNIIFKNNLLFPEINCSRTRN